jgi:cytochrome b
MHEAMSEQSDSKRKVLVWDLPVRVFHWLLVLLIVSQIVTVSIGGNAMEYHVLGGYAILTLVVFRMLWGLLGTPTARFVNFLRGPQAVLRYARSLASREPEQVTGHNPLGGLSVVAMLISILVQAVSGLFADDDVGGHGQPGKRHPRDQCPGAADTDLHPSGRHFVLPAAQEREPDQADVYR